MYANALLPNDSYPCPPPQYVVPQSYHQAIHPHNAGPTPNLPPKLRESERMRFVQLWVNNIPEPCGSETASAISVSTGTTSSSSHFSGHRLFDEEETAELRETFRDYLSSGTVPSLADVRQLMANSPMLIHRTPVSIRNKIKRLQSNASRQVSAPRASLQLQSNTAATTTLTTPTPIAAQTSAVHMLHTTPAQSNFVM